MRMAASIGPRRSPDPSGPDPRDAGRAAELFPTIVALLRRGPLAVEEARAAVHAEADAVRAALKALALRGLARNIAPDCWSPTGALRTDVELVVNAL